MLQKDPESLHCYLRIYFLPGVTNSGDIRFYLPRLRPEGTYMTICFSKPSIDDDQPKSLVGIQGHFGSAPCSNCDQTYGHSLAAYLDPNNSQHYIFTAVAVPSLILLHKQLQSEDSSKRRILMWRTWAPGRARFIVGHDRTDYGAQILGMKFICRQGMSYEFGFPEVEEMVRLRFGQLSSSH